MSFGITNAKEKKVSNNLSFESIVVETTDWVASVLYADYPYQATIITDASLIGVGAIGGLVEFEFQEEYSSNYCGNAELDTTNGTITIYAREIPSANFTIPKVIIYR